MHQGLYHGFMLVEFCKHNYSKYSELIFNDDKVSFHDDFMYYIGDFMKWIPSYNPMMDMKAMYGLNFIGNTIIKVNGANIMKPIFDALADLFSVGPRTYEITGDYGWPEGVETQEGGSYEKIPIDRDEMVGNLRAVSQLCEGVIESNDQKYLLHIGV